MTKTSTKATVWEFKTNAKVESATSCRHANELLHNNSIFFFYLSQRSEQMGIFSSIPCIVGGQTGAAQN
jgi:hypothetical protein